MAASRPIPSNRSDISDESNLERQRENIRRLRAWVYDPESQSNGEGQPGVEQDDKNIHPSEAMPVQSSSQTDTSDEPGIRRHRESTQSHRTWMYETSGNPDEEDRCRVEQQHDENDRRSEATSTKPLDQSDTSDEPNLERDGKDIQGQEAVKKG